MADPENVKPTYSTITMSSAIGHQLVYVPQGETLREFHGSTEFVRIIVGCLGAGKTHACFIELFRLAQDMPVSRDGVARSRILIARSSYTDLKTSALQDFKEILGPIIDQIGNWRMEAPAEFKATWVHPVNGHKIETALIWAGLDAIDGESKIRSLNLTHAYLVEIAQFDRKTVNQVMGRLGRFPSRAQCPQFNSHLIGCTNAPARDHWLAKLILEDKPDRWAFFLQPPALIRKQGQWVLNPKAENTANLPPDYYTRQAHGASDAWIQSNLCNEFVEVHDHRPVHPAFNASLHVADYELQADPSSDALFGHRLWSYPQRWCLPNETVNAGSCYRSCVFENTGARELGRVLKQHLDEHYPRLNIVATGDLSGGYGTQVSDETAFDALSFSGIEATPAESNDFEIRTDALDVLLTQLVKGEPKILISPNCMNLIRGLSGGYFFRRVQVTGQERYEDKPYKSKTSHICEALHYCLMGAGVGGFIGQDWLSEMEEIENSPSFEGWHPDIHL